eukprot:216228-Prymnesium_polylepis.1
MDSRVHPIRIPYTHDGTKQHASRASHTVARVHTGVPPAPPLASARDPGWVLASPRAATGGNTGAKHAAARRARPRWPRGRSSLGQCKSSSTALLLALALALEALALGALGDGALGRLRLPALGRRLRLGRCRLLSPVVLLRHPARGATRRAPLVTQEGASEAEIRHGRVGIGVTLGARARIARPRIAIGRSGSHPRSRPRSTALTATPRAAPRARARACTCSHLRDSLVTTVRVCVRVRVSHLRDSLAATSRLIATALSSGNIFETTLAARAASLRTSSLDVAVSYPFRFPFVFDGSFATVLSNRPADAVLTCTAAIDCDRYCFRSRRAPPPAGSAPPAASASTAAPSGRPPWPRMGRRCRRRPALPRPASRAPCPSGCWRARSRSAAPTAASSRPTPSSIASSSRSPSPGRSAPTV